MNLLSVSCGFSERSEPGGWFWLWEFSVQILLTQHVGSGASSSPSASSPHFTLSHIRSIRDDILLLCSSRAAPVSLWASAIWEGVHNKPSTIKLPQRLHSCQTNMEAGQLPPHDLVQPIDPFFFNESNLRSGTGADERHVEASCQHVCCQRSESCWRLHTWCPRLCAASFSSSILKVETNEHLLLNSCSICI